jgi:hypothetical protein
MRLGRVVRLLWYFLIGVLLAGMAGRSSLFAGDGGPYVLQHDLREDSGARSDPGCAQSREPVSWRRGDGDG